MTFRGAAKKAGIGDNPSIGVPVNTFHKQLTLFMLNVLYYWLNSSCPFLTFLSSLPLLSKL